MRRAGLLLIVLAVAATACNQVSDEGRDETTSASGAATTATQAVTSTAASVVSSTTTTTAPTEDAGPLAVAETATQIQHVLVSGEHKTATASERDDPITYNHPGADDTQVGRVRYRDDATLDLYYPPGYRFDELLPAVVFANAWSTTEETILIQPDGEPMDESLGTADFQNSDSFISMGNLVSAAGLIGIVHGTTDDPAVDLDEAMTWVMANAEALGVDASRTAAWMWSAHTLTGLRIVMEKGPWQDALDAVIVYYGWMPLDTLRADLPIHMVKALEDLPFFIESQDAFMDAAAEVAAPIDDVEVQGPHNFDRVSGQEDSTAQAFDSTLTFLDTVFAGEG